MPHRGRYNATYIVAYDVRPAVVWGGGRPICDLLVSLGPEYVVMTYVVVVVTLPVFMVRISCMHIAVDVVIVTNILVSKNCRGVVVEVRLGVVATFALVALCML